MDRSNIIGFRDGSPIRRHPESTSDPAHIADYDALRDEWEGVLRQHGMRGERCICGAWWTAADQFGSVDQFRRHLAGVIATRVYSPGEGSVDA